PVLCGCVDQIEPSMAGAWGGSDAEERCGIGVARAVAKAAGTSAEWEVREVLQRAGVVDWYAFVASHVVANAGPYRGDVATFHARRHYRWVAPEDLPVP